MKLSELLIIRDTLKGLTNPGEALEIVERTVKAIQGQANVLATKWAHYAPQYGLKVEQFGKTFYAQGRSYQITDIVPSRPRFPVSAKRLPDGKGFKFPAHAAKGAR